MLRTRRCRLDPIHYLPLIERKINALDQAAPLAEWDLPEEFRTLRRLMEAHLLKMGRRAYVQVLHLLETFSLDEAGFQIVVPSRFGYLRNAFPEGSVRRGPQEFDHRWRKLGSALVNSSFEGVREHLWLLFDRKQRDILLRPLSNPW